MAMQWRQHRRNWLVIGLRKTSSAEVGLRPVYRWSRTAKCCHRILRPPMSWGAVVTVIAFYIDSSLLFLIVKRAVGVTRPTASNMFLVHRNFV